jgi:hypothetical protein
MSQITRPRTPTLSLFALLLFTGMATGEPDTTGNIHLLTLESMRQSKHDEAEERIRTWKASQPSDPNLRKAVHLLARSYSLNESSAKREKAIRYFEYLVEKFPKDDDAVAWWLGLGMTLVRDRQTERGVSALERGMALLDEPNRPAARDLPDSAFEWVGEYYIENKEWDKAIRVLEKWRPNSGCGTCNESMRAIRSQGILFSLIQSSHHPEAVNRLWQVLEGSDYYIGDTASFALIRLYQEAGQLADLKTLLPELAGGSDGLNAAIAALNQEDEFRKLPPRQANAARIHKALVLVDDTQFETRMAPFLAARSKSGRSVDRLDSRVATWLLVRDRQVIERQVIERHVRAATNDANYDKQALMKILDLMANPHHFEGFANRFFERWPQPKPGSLPKTLPLVTESTTAR